MVMINRFCFPLSFYLLCMTDSACAFAVQVGLHIMQSVPAHFRKLVQLVGRAFYASECPPRDQDPEATQGPRKGTNVRTASATLPCLH